MYARSRLLRFLPVLAVALSFVACNNDDSPTTPSGGQPEITSISPAALEPSDIAQTVTFTGTGFDAGLQLLATAPDGTSLPIDSGAVQSVQPTAFQATLLLNQTGTYSFAVRNASGVGSAAFTTVVQPPGSSLPLVYSVAPLSIARNSFQSTLVALQGANFAPNAAVFLTDPNGMTMILTSASLSLQSNTAIQFSFTFNIRGTYSLMVSNPNGDRSNPIAIQVT